MENSNSMKLEGDTRPAADKPLSLSQFREMPAGTIFSRAVIWHDNQQVRIIAIKSRTPGCDDWAIYYLPIGYETLTMNGKERLIIHNKPDSKVDSYISKMGWKITDENTVKGMMAVCTEVFELYRY